MAWQEEGERRIQTQQGLASWAANREEAHWASAPVVKEHMRFFFFLLGSRTERRHVRGSVSSQSACQLQRYRQSQGVQEALWAPCARRSGI